MAKKIIPYIDDEDQKYFVYVEPFAGAANVFFQKKPHKLEVINDKAYHIVSVFRCLQDQGKCKRLMRRLKCTPYSRAEFAKALDVLKTSKDEEELAWATMVAYGQSFGGSPNGSYNWAFSWVIANGIPQPISAYHRRIEQIEFFHKRLRGVYLDCKDVFYVLEKYDTAKTVFYLDPPYVPETRVKGHRKVYLHEMTREEHIRLVKAVTRLKGKVVLSGYDNDIYRCLEKVGWKRVDFSTVCYAVQCYGKRSKRTECLWINKR